jgi:hypothetical protein
MSQQITFSQGNVGANLSIASGVCTLSAGGSNVTKGHLLVAMWGAYSSPTLPTSVTDSLGTTFYKAFSYLGLSSGISCWIGLAPSTGADTISWHGVAGADNAGIVLEYVVPQNFVVAGSNSGFNLNGNGTVTTCLFMPYIAGAWNVGTETMTITAAFDQASNPPLTSNTVGANIREHTEAITGSESMAAGDLDNVATIAPGSTTAFGWNCTGGTLAAAIVLAVMTPIASGGPVGSCFVM